MADRTMFIVQPYQAKPHRLVGLAAQVFADEGSARAAARRLARFRAGIVVLAQTVDVATARKGKPSTIAIHGTVPAVWNEGLAA